MATKKGDDPKKKKVTAANTAAMTDNVKKQAAMKAASKAKAEAEKRKVTPANTAAKTDYNKKAVAVNAAAGTKLAMPGSPMAAKQSAYNKEKQAAGTASSTNRDSRLHGSGGVAARLKSQAATEDNNFSTATNNRLAGKFGK